MSIYVSYETAVQLKGANFPQETHFFYDKTAYKPKERIFTAANLMYPMIEGMKVAAPTFEEIWGQLPETLDNGHNTKKQMNDKFIYYGSFFIVPSQKSPVEAVAQLYIRLKKESYFTPSSSDSII